MQAVHKNEDCQAEGLADVKTGFTLYIAAYKAKSDGHKRQQHGVAPVDLFHIVGFYWLVAPAGTTLQPDIERIRGKYAILTAFLRTFRSH